MQNTKFKGYPTTHANLNFRSRLEAKWAEFFNQLQWVWDYEPVDFNGWIPDFAIYGKNQITYVEVKPVSVFPVDVSCKIEKIGCKNEVLIVGISPKLVVCDLLPSQLCIGWLRDSVCRTWAPAPLSVWGESFGFCHSEDSYRDRVTGKTTGYPYGDFEFEDDVKDEALKLWAKAANAVQWKP